MNAETPNIQIQPSQSADSGGHTLDLHELLRIGLKYKWGIFGLAILIAVLAALWAFRQPSVYKATSKLLIERQGTKYVSIEETYGGSPYSWEYYQTQYEILKSRPVAARAAQSLGLLDDIDVTDTAPEVTGWRSWFPEDWFPPPPPPTESEVENAVVAGLQGSVIVDPVRNSQLVRISIEGTDPQQVADRANAIVDAYISENLEGQMQMTQNANLWLMERMQELQTNLSNSEAALQAFVDREQILDMDAVDTLASQELTLVNQRLASLRQTLAEKRTAWQQVQSAREAGVPLSSVPALRDDDALALVRREYREAQREVAELQSRYGPKHPRMIAAQTQLQSTQSAMDEQLASLAKTIEFEYSAAQEAVRDAERSASGSQADIQEINRKQFQLNALRREVENNRQILDLFQKQQKGIEATGGVQTSNARVVEYANVPKTPIRPNRQRSIVLAFFIGLVGAFGLAYLLERLDNTLKGQEDVERRLELPVLGLLPMLSDVKKGELTPITHFESNKHTIFSEAIRTIRTGVLLSAIDEPHRILLVTSSLPGEGKTTLSMNLSIALSQMKKVLLIDADMRRPTLGRAMGKPVRQTKGLSDVIAGNAKFDECIQKLENQNLHILPSGSIPPNPLEILSSARFESAISQLSERYDHVVVDCAPALAVSDSLVLSKMANAVIYVVRSDSTPAKLAQLGVKRLRRVDAPLIGAVVNRVVQKSTRYGRYGRYAPYQDQYYADYGYNTSSKS